MKKVNLEKKINLALNEAVNALRVCEDLDFNTRDNYCKYAFTASLRARFIFFSRFTFFIFNYLIRSL